MVEILERRILTVGSIRQIERQTGNYVVTIKCVFRNLANIAKGESGLREECPERSGACVP